MFLDLRLKEEYNTFRVYLDIILKNVDLIYIISFIVKLYL